MSATVWLVTLLVLGLILTIDLLIAITNRHKVTTIKAAAIWTVFYISLAIAFGLSMGSWGNAQAQGEFFAGWITEYSLSMDNLFVFILILARMKVSQEKEELVLLIGIVMSLFLRGIFIGAGSALVNRWSWVFFIFGAFLLYTAYKLIAEDSEEEYEEGPFIRFLHKKGASYFVIALSAIATTNVIFAFDSIPAIFGLTKDPYIVVTANIFALMGLRQLYFIIGGLMKKLIYLSEGLAIILGFIGLKLIFEASHFQGWEKFFGVPIPEISLPLSLSVILGVLLLTTVLSLLKGQKKIA
ncbi:MAG: TerC family protein [Actinomycetes bacterium]|jgi:tellurite resistance protein TerC